MSSSAFLLDANVLIALATPEHSLNSRAASWFRLGHRFATCPITQGALVRFHLRSGVDATAESAKQLLKAICSLPRHEFWPDSESYLDLKTANISGHRQITDAYLVLLAASRKSALITMDSALAATHPQAILIPA